MRLRVGLTQRLEWIESRQEMREMLDVAWAQRLHALGVQPCVLPARGVAPGALLDEYGIQVLILTGGNQSEAAAGDAASKERNTLEAALLSAAQSSRVPVLGVCHGMQVMNLFLGGRVSTIADHVRKPHGIEGRAAALLVAGQVNTFHDTGIRPQELASALTPVGLAPDGSVEAAVHREQSWLGIMWHPERAMPEGVDGMAAVAAFLRDPAGLCSKLRGESA